MTTEWSLPPEDVQAAADRAFRDDELRAARARLAIRVKEFKASLPFGTFCHYQADQWRAFVGDPRLQAFADQYDPKLRGNCLILGVAGVGKTVAAAASAHRLLSNAFATGDENAVIARAVWVSAPMLTRERRETKRGTRDELLERAMVAPLAYIDELGGEDTPDGRWLMELADARYTANLVTVTTSWLPLDELRARYGSGAVRRLIEPGGSVLNTHVGTVE